MAAHGDPNPSHQPLLALHWAVTSVGFAVFVGASVYTQMQLYQLQKRKATIQSLISPDTVTLLLVVTLFYYTTALVYGAAMQSMPCWIYVLLPHLCSSAMAAIEIYLTLSFTHRLAVTQCCKHYLLFSSAERPDANAIKYARFVESVASFLDGNRIRYLSWTIYFVLLLVVLLDPSGREQLMGRAPFCTLRSSTMVIVGLLLFTIAYIIFLRRFDVIDPYRITFKLKLFSGIGMWGMFMFFLISQLVDPLVGWPHATLFGMQVVFVLQMAIWYIESYIPMKLTEAKAKEAAQCLDTTSILDTLSNPTLLKKFERRLIEEWSLESLEFFKAVVMLDIEAKNLISRAQNTVGSKTSFSSRSPNGKRNSINLRPLQLNCLDAEDKKTHFTPRQAEMKCLDDIVLDLVRGKAYDIYRRFVAYDARYQVSLSSKIAARLHRFFGRKEFSKYKEMHEPPSLVFFSNVGSKVERLSFEVSDNADRKQIHKNATTNGIPSSIKTLCLPNDQSKEKKSHAKITTETSCSEKSPITCSNSMLKPVTGQETSKENNNEIDPILYIQESPRASFAAKDDHVVCLNSSYHRPRLETPDYRKRRSSIKPKFISAEQFCKALSDAAVTHMSDRSTIDALPQTSLYENAVCNPNRFSDGKQLESKHQQQPSSSLIITRTTTTTNNKQNIGTIGKIHSCIQAFEEARIEVFDLMETDTHRRFAANLNRNL